MKKIIYFLFLIGFTLSAHSLFAQKKQKKNMFTTIFFNLSTANSQGLGLIALYKDIEITEIKSSRNLKSYKCVIPNTYSDDIPIVAIQRNGTTLGMLKNGKIEKYEFSIKEIRSLKLPDEKENKNEYTFILSS